MPRTIEETFSMPIDQDATDTQLESWLEILPDAIEKVAHVVADKKLKQAQAKDNLAMIETQELALMDDVQYGTITAKKAALPGRDPVIKSKEELRDATYEFDYAVATFRKVEEKSTSVRKICSLRIKQYESYVRTISSVERERIERTGGRGNVNAGSSRGGSPVDPVVNVKVVQNSPMFQAAASDKDVDTDDSEKDTGFME